MTSDDNNNSSGDRSKDGINSIAAIGGSLTMVWFAGSLGTPLISSMYVNYLGRTIGLINVSPSKVENTNKKVFYYPDAFFIKQLKTSEVFPWLTMLGPLSIPISGLYCVSSTIGYACYRYRMYKDGSNVDK